MNLSERLGYQRGQSITKLPKQMNPIRTLEETARLMGCTKANVWLIERQAIYKVIRRMREAIRTQ